MKAACLVLVAAFWCANGDEQFMSATHAAKTRREVLGSLQEMNGKESQLVKELSNYAVSTLDDIDADNIKRTVVDIIDAKKQLVNGIMYHLELKIQDTSCIEDQDLSLDDSCLSKTTGHPKICKIRLHRAFVTKSPHDTKVVSSECNDEYEMSKAQDVPANSAYIRSIAEFASEYLNKMTNSIYWFKLINIMEAKTQIVGGINTYLTLELHSTSCSKHDSFKSDEACTVDPATKSKMLCRVVVLEQPDHEKHMKKSSCSTHEEPQLVKNGAKKASGQLTKKGSKKAKRSLLGSEAPVEANDENVESLKKFLSHQLTSRANSEYIKRVVEVLNVSSQVVSGKLTRATVRVADTNCLKSENRIASECELSALGQQLCTVTILEQPWLNKKELTQSECHAVSAVIGKGQNTKLKDLAKLLRVDANSKDLLDFSEFMTRENKIYKTNQETVQRFHIFRANMLKAAYLNKTEQGTAWYGATMFADLTKSEFRQYTGLNYDPKKPMKKLPKMAEVPNINIPPEFDWRDHNVVTPVKNQGLCGSCWAFSVTGNIEGLNAIASGTLTSFSEQELVDCDKLDSGCNGGFFNTAFESIEELGGLETESDYPYAGVNEKCYLDKSKVKVQVKDYVNITSDENEMAKWLVANGPISIALNANAMQFYMGGVSHPFRFLCDPDNLDHGVLIVGYGVHRTRYTHKLLPYWLIKNSWGPRWGNKGYYMAYRGDGTCGLNKAPTSAILE